MITVMEKPEWISYDEIAELLHEAHRENVGKGLNYSASHQNGGEIKALLHENGKFYVALINGNELAGVSAIEIRERSTRWFAKEQPYGEIKLEGIKPEYQGMRISSMLREAIAEYAFQRIELLVLDTAEKNKHAIAINKKRGWRIVDYTSRQTNNFYSVVMAQWKNGCPYSEGERLFHFWIKKAYVRLRYTKYGKQRCRKFR